MPLSYEDLIANKNETYKGYGFGSKNDNVGASLARLVLPNFDQALQGALFQLELEPERQAMIRAIIANSNPANMQAQALGQGNQMINQAGSQGHIFANQIAQAGGNQGAQLGALAQAQNQGTEAANNLLLQANSPGAQNEALGQGLAAIGQSQGQGMENLLAMFDPIQQKTQNAMARKQGQGLGGLAPILGSVLGSVNFGGIGAGKKAAKKSPFATGQQWLGNLGGLF